MVKVLKIKIRCKSCGWEAEVDVNPSPLGALRPGKGLQGAGKTIKIDWNKDQVDKILEATGGHGAGREDLRQLGIRIPIPQWNEGIERRKLRQFLKKNLKICKDLRTSQGERSRVSTAPWVMGDSFRDIDLASSEVKSMGIDDMRLIPGLTLQKRVFEHSKGSDREVLKGVKFFNIIDTSGSMFGGYGTEIIEKIHKALMMAEETYKICKKLGYDFNLAIFSGSAARIKKKRIPLFFKDENERGRYEPWGGGTNLASALKVFSLEELKDGNVVIMSDMNIADTDETVAMLKKIGQVTNSFKVVIIEHISDFGSTKTDEIQKLFPNKKVEILSMRMKG